jgi:hypothetical protein
MYLCSAASHSLHMHHPWDVDQWDVIMLSEMYIHEIMHVARQPCCMRRVIHVIHVSLQGTEMEGYIGHAHLEILEVSSSGGQTSVLCLCVCVFVSLCLCSTLYLVILYLMILYLVALSLISL